jgi:hypothetical protein
MQLVMPYSVPGHTNDTKEDVMATRAGRKVQTQLLMPAETRARATAVAIASGYVRAEVLRQMVDAQMPAMEKRHAAGLARLDAVAARFGMTRGDLAESMADDKLTLEDVEKLDSYPRATAPVG